MSDIRQELSELQHLQGIDFVRQLKQITSRKEFLPLASDPDIFHVGGEDDADFPRLLDAARKAVEHGYRAFLLPNPKGIRTADFIFVRKGVYKLYDLKTITGANSIGNTKQSKSWFIKAERASLCLGMKQSTEHPSSNISWRNMYNKRAAETTLLKWAVSIKPYPHAGISPG